MRIISGLNKGKRLKIPKRGIRPTKAVVRQAIFNIIRDKICCAVILDVFAGTGALGIEAIARGAKYAVFIEKVPKTLFYNLKIFNLANRTKVISGDFRMGLRKSRNLKYDIIFIDPPYKMGYLSKTLQLIAHYNLLEHNGVIVAEHYTKEQFFLPENYSVIKEKHYGETAVSFISFRLP